MLETGVCYAYPSHCKNGRIVTAGTKSQNKPDSSVSNKAVHMSDIEEEGVIWKDGRHIIESEVLVE